MLLASRADHQIAANAVDEPSLSCQVVDRKGTSATRGNGGTAILSGWVFRSHQGPRYALQKRFGGALS